MKPWDRYADVPWIPPAFADENGLVGVGGNLDPSCLLRAYTEGVFPWFSDGDPILWWSPDPRAIFDIRSGLHVSRRLARTIRSGKFTVTFNRAFGEVIRACGDRPEGTWITREMVSAYEDLHRLRFAHSVEAWQDGELAGGVYGVAINGFFAAGVDVLPTDGRLEGGAGGDVRATAGTRLRSGRYADADRTHRAHGGVRGAREHGTWNCCAGRSARKAFVSECPMTRTNDELHWSLGPGHCGIGIQ